MAEIRQADTVQPFWEKRQSPASAAERNRRWREANPAKVAAYKEKRRIPPTKLVCTECAKEFYGRKDRLTCGRRCLDARYRRLHPEEWRQRRRRHDARVRARKRGEA